MCNRCDVHETPRSIALAVQAEHPACAQLLLGPAFEEQLRTAENAWTMTRCASVSLFELAAQELLTCKAFELVAPPPPPPAAPPPPPPLSAMHSLEDLLEACIPSALACVPDALRERVASVWPRAKERASRQAVASAECLKLGTLYLRGEGVPAEEAHEALDPGIAVPGSSDASERPPSGSGWWSMGARLLPAWATPAWLAPRSTQAGGSNLLASSRNETAAVHWLVRGLRCRPVEHVASCWRWHIDYCGNASDTCSSCAMYATARAALAKLATSATVAGAAAAAALVEDAQRSAALLESPLHALELQRQAVKEQLVRALREEFELRRREAAAAQQLQDERFDAEVRAPEVARCAQFAEQRRASASGGECTNRRCESQDYCTYWHFGRHDLPPRCRWFAEGTCHNGERCWYNHLKRRPPRVAVPYY